MLSLKAIIRQKTGRALDGLRRQGVLPGVLYGEGIGNNLILEVGEKEFARVFKQAGESSLVELDVDGKKYQVLIHQIAHDPVSGKVIHVDFFHPSEKKKIEAEVPLVFKGTAPAEKDLGGVLVKEFTEVQVKGLARNLPREIDVDVSALKTFDDRVLIKDLSVPADVVILREGDEVVAHVTSPRKIEEEKPVEKEEAEPGKEEGEGPTQEQRAETAEEG